MPTNFPTSVDNFTNPTANDSLNLPSHSTQHANANDAIEAIEGYLLNGGQGLTLIKKQTVGTAVSSVTVTGAFSATYEGYRIVWTGGVCGGNNELTLQLGGITSGYESLLMYGAFGANTGILGVNGGGAQWGYAGGGSTSGAMLDIEIWNPFQAKRKWGRAQFQQLINGNNGLTTLYATSTASATSFTIANGTLTGGTIYVYGYGMGQ